MPDDKQRRRSRGGAAAWPAHWRRWGGYLLALAALLLLAAFFYSRSGSRPPAYGQPWLEFSGEKALAHVQALVDLGPRPPASDAIEQARKYIEQNLKQVGWEVSKQGFNAETPRGTVHFVNLIAHWPSALPRAQKFLLCSHYDTKTFDSIKFVGANDGGSSTGALLEMARVLSLHPQLAEKLELVFFDGEEAYENFTATDGLYGSRFFARRMKAADAVKLYRGAILWDMIGDKDLGITLSPDSPVQMTRDIFDAAAALKARDDFTYSSSNILDDHTPLNKVGVPAIDLIDFDYPPWHTAGDTMDKLSAASLQTIGAVTAYYLAEMAFR